MLKYLLLMLCLFISCNTLAQLKDNPHKMSSVIKADVTDFTPHGTQPLTLTYHISNGAKCKGCHAGPRPNDAKVMPSSTWSGSMMANATRDPLFWAAVDIANQDIPGVGDFCIRCHTPLGFYRGHTKDGTGDMSYANGCELEGKVTDSLDTETNDYQGVTCHFCHRLEPKGPNNEELTFNNANVWIDDEACDFPGSTNNGPCRKGPYNDYNGTTGFNDPPHDWSYSPFIKKGEFCGSCHNVSSPEIMTPTGLQIAKTLIDQDGTDTQIAFPIERTFAEWQNSIYSDLIYRDSFGSDSMNNLEIVNTGKSCQDCHMPNTDDLDARVCRITPVGQRANNAKKHTFSGGNSWMLEVMKNTYGTALGRNEEFDQNIQSSLDMLQTKSAVVETTLTTSNTNSAQVKVKITNLTGHKLPTGYPEGRRMWINLQVKDSTNTLIYQSGAYNISTAVLTEDTDIKIYETLQGIWDTNTSTCVTEQGGNKVFHFALNNCVAKDNRIPPLGFRGGENLEIKPIGLVYPTIPNNSNILVNYDETNYSFNIPPGTPLPLSVTASLMYQTSSKEYIDFLDDESTTASENSLCNRNPLQVDGPADLSRGAFMKLLWENNNKSAPVNMGTSIVTITE